MGYDSDNDLIGEAADAEPCTPPLRRHPSARRRPTQSPSVTHCASAAPSHSRCAGTGWVGGFGQQTATEAMETVPNVPSNSSDEEAAPDAAASNEGVTAMLSSATAGVVGKPEADQGSGAASQGQLRRRHRARAAAAETDRRSTATSHGSLDFGFVSGRSRAGVCGEVDDEWSGFKGA